MSVLFGARVFGGLAAGMAYPTTLALITALWSGPARTRSIALWAATRRSDRRARPAVLRDPARALLVGLGVPAHAAARGDRAGDGGRARAGHVNEGRSRSTTSGGCLSIVLVGALVLGINFAAVPNETMLVVGLFVSRRRRSSPSTSASGGRANPLYDLRVAARPTFWVAACAGHDRVRLADGRDVHRTAVPPERARLLDRRRRGWRSCPPPCSWSGGAPLGQARREATARGRRC